MDSRPIAGLAALFASLACAVQGPPSAPASDAGELPRADAGVLYAVGMALGQQVQSYQLDEDEAREVMRGFRDGSTGQPYAGVQTEETSQQVAKFHESRLGAIAHVEELAGAPVLERAASEPGAVKTESGMVLRVIEAGSGEPPTIFDRVRVNYRGTLRDGTVFDSNDGKDAIRVQLGTTPRCWQEALGSVGAGARLHVTCPPSLGYRWHGLPGVVPGGAVLSYDFELISIEREAPPPNWSPG